MSAWLRLRRAPLVWGVTFVSLLAIAAQGARAASRSAPPIAREAACTNSVTFGLIQATTAGCDLQIVSPGEWQSTATVTVNGIPFTPVPGTNLTLISPTAASPGGSLSVKLQNPISAAGISWLSNGAAITWNLPAGSAGTEANVVSTGTLNGDKLFGFAVRGAAEVRIGWDATNNLRYFKFVANLELPSVFKNGPEKDAGGLTASVGLRVDSAGVHADAVKASVSNAYVGALQIKSLCLSYVAAGGTSATPCTPPPYMGEKQFLTCSTPGNVSRWDGAAEVVLPTADRPSVGVYAGVQNGAFSYAGLQVGSLGNSLPIAQGVYVDNFALALCVTPPPLKFKGAAGINIGPSVQGRAPLTLNGSLEYVDSRPWVLEAKGNVLVEGYKLSDGFLRYTSNNTINFGFNAGFDFKVASVKASVSGWVQARPPVRFNVVGTGSVCLGAGHLSGCTNGDVTVSSQGLAGCFTVASVTYPDLVGSISSLSFKTKKATVRAGVGYTWSTKKVSIMGNSCDISKYETLPDISGLLKILRPGHTGVAAALPTLPTYGAANPAVQVPLSVPAGLAALSLQIRGYQGAPAVSLHAPDGTTYTEPRAGDEIKPGLVFATDPASDATDVEIAHPVAGTWSVITSGDDSTIKTIKAASVDLPPSILAGVRGSGFERTLQYAYVADPGHTISFVERGPNDEHVLGAAAGTVCHGDAHLTPTPRCGTIPFVPDTTTAAGPHAIIAVVTNASTGEITEERRVVSYDAPAEPEPSGVGDLTATRSGTGVVVSWKRSTEAIAEAKPDDYNADVTLSTGAQMLAVMPQVTDESHYSVTIPNVPTTTGVRITVRPMRGDDTQGALRTLTLAAGAASVGS